MTAIDWKEVVTASSALLSPTVAVLTLYIAWQQWTTNKSRELRESRQSKLSVYRRVRLVLRHVLYSQTIDPKLYADFCDACAEADFLFEDELRTWLNELQEIAAHCMTLQEPLSNLSTLATDGAINRMYRDLDNETDKLRKANKDLREKFSRYMAL